MRLVAVGQSCSACTVKGRRSSRTRREEKPVFDSRGCRARGSADRESDREIRRGRVVDANDGSVVSTRVQAHGALRRAALDFGGEASGQRAAAGDDCPASIRCAARAASERSRSGVDRCYPEIPSTWCPSIGQLVRSSACSTKSAARRGGVRVESDLSRHRWNWRAGRLARGVIAHEEDHPQVELLHQVEEHLRSAPRRGPQGVRRVSRAFPL